MAKPVALVTGGTRGIGYGCARHLAAEGFDLVLNGVRSEKHVQPVLTALTKSGARVGYIAGDVAAAKDRASIVAQVKSQFGRLNVLVNNAGIAPRERRDILETSADSFDDVLAVNLRGPFFLTQAVAKWMIAQKTDDAAFAGCIVNISSISAQVASVNRGEYCISKAGLSMATKLFADRLDAYDIPVYEVQPGIIRTDMTAAVTEKYDQMIGDGLCITRRWGTPDDVGKAVAALAGGRFPYATGQIVMIDGGLTIPRL